MSLFQDIAKKYGLIKQAVSLYSEANKTNAQTRINQQRLKTLQNPTQPTQSGGLFDDIAKKFNLQIPKVPQLVTGQKQITPTTILKTQDPVFGINKPGAGWVGKMFPGIEIIAQSIEQKSLTPLKQLGNDLISPRVLTPFGASEDFTKKQIDAAIQFDSLFGIKRKPEDYQVTTAWPEAAAMKQFELDKMTADEARSILGVAKNATKETINNLYKKVVHSPEISKVLRQIETKTGTQSFKLLNKAREVLLKDTEKPIIVTPTKLLGGQVEQPKVGGVPEVTNPLAQEARKYNSAEEFVKAKIDDYVKTTPEYKKWSTGAKNIQEAYHGTPYSFDEFKTQFEKGGKRTGAYETEGISFATTKSNAEPFSRQYPESFFTEKKVLDSKYPKVSEIKQKIEDIAYNKKLRSVESIKKEGMVLIDSLNKEWNDKKDWLFNNNYEKFKDRNTYSLGRIKELKEELKHVQNRRQPNLTSSEIRLSKQYDTELQALENKTTGNIYKVHIKGNKVITQNGEEIGFTSGREQEIGEAGKNGYLYIKNADTGQYIGDEIMTSNPKNVFIINQEKFKSQLTDIYNQATKGVIKTTSQTNDVSGVSSSELSQIPEASTQIVSPKEILSSPTNVTQPSSIVKRPPSLQQLGLKDKPNLITTREDVLLRERLRNQARGAKAGYKEAKNKITTQLQTEITNQRGVRNEIVDYVKANIPIGDRGVFLNMVKDAKSQEDLTKAFVRIDRKAESILVKQALTELKKSVSKISDNNSVSADYKNKIKDILDDYELSGHNQSTIDKIKATQEFINRQISIGEDVELPQRIINKLKILERTPKDQLTIEQIQTLQNEIDLLAKLGETKWSSKQALYDAEKDFRKKELLASATSINSRQVKGIGLEKSPSKFIQSYLKTRNYLQKTRVGLTPMEGIADITGMQPMKNVMDLNFGNYLSYNDENIKNWYELTKTFDDSNFKRIGAYAISKQAGGIERLANSDITQEQVDNLNLTPEEMKAYNFVRDTFDKEFPAVKKYALDVYNKDVGEVKNYVSFMSDNDAMNELEMYDRFGNADENAARTKTVEQGFTEKRLAEAKTKLELNIDKIFRRHTDDVAYMLTMGKDIKQYFEVVNTPEMKVKLGDVGSMAWLQYLDLLARKGGSEGAKRIVILDTIRKNLAAGVLSFRISSAMVQFTSFADSMATIGAEWSMKGATSIATSREWRNFVMDNFPEVRKAVGDDIAFREFGDGFLSKASQKGLMPLQKLDGLMRSTAVSGAYQKLCKEKGIEVDLSNPDKQIIQEATKLMRHSQGSSFFKDQPLSLTTNFGLTDNKSLNKTILTFQSFMLARWDNMQRQMWRLGIKDKEYKKAFMSFFWMIIVASAMEETIRRGVKWGISKGSELITGKDSGTQYGSFTGNSVLNVIQSVPIMGQLVSSMEYSSNPIPTINTFEQVLSGATSVWNGKVFQTKLRGAETLLGAAGSLAGVPGSSQISQLLKGVTPSVNSKPKSNIPSADDILKKYGIGATSNVGAQAILDKYGL